MANIVETIFRAVDESSEVIDKINEKQRESKEKTDEEKTSLVDLNAAFEIAGRVIDVAAQAYDAIITRTLDYVDSVDQLSQISGQSAESTSRLIGLTTEYGVKVEALTMANKTLSSEGLTLSIDTLSKLSEEYLQIGNDADRAKFLTDNFGRSGYDLADIMELGADAIRKQSDAIDPNLILTQKAIDETKEFTIAQEKLKQAQDALAVNIGTKMAPVLTEMINNYLDGVKAYELAVAGGEKYAGVQQYVALALQTQVKAERESADAMKTSTAAAAVQTQSMQEIEAAAKAEEDAIRNLTEVNKGMISMVGQYQSVEENFTKRMEDNTAERISLEKERADKLKQGYSESGSVIKELDKKLADNALAARQNADEHEKASRRIMLQYLEQQLAQDGLSTKETEFLLEKGKQWGIYSQEAIDAMRNAMSEANNLAGSIQDIPTAKTITITTRYNDVYSTTTAENSMVRAHAAGGTFMIPESYGNEGFRMGNGDTASGGEMVTITPKGQAPGNSGIDYDRLARVFRDALMQVTR